MSTDAIPESLDLERQHPVEFLGHDGVLRFFTNKKGLNIACYFWPAAQSFAKPRGIIQIFHGHGCYLPYDYLTTPAPGKLSLYAGSWVEKMNQAGFSVCGIDQQGAGRSEGLRCYCESFDDYVENTATLVRMCTEMGVPKFPSDSARFLLGASLGGCTAIFTALKTDVKLDGVILMAPMLSLEKLATKGLNPYLKPLATLVSSVAPTLQCAKAEKNSKFPDVQEAFEKDPNNYHGMTRARNATEYLRVTSWLMRHLDSIEFPFVVYHSEGDTMCDCDGSKELYAQAASADKTLKLVNQFWHVLTKEPGNLELLQEMLDWAAARCLKAPATPPQPKPAAAMPATVGVVPQRPASPKRST